MKFKNKLLGFTLIEILVVIGIMTILVALLPPSYRLVFQKGKDTIRKNDLKQYQIALENYANENDSVYPLFPTPVSAFSVLCPVLNKYMSKCLEDEKNLNDGSFAYLYESSQTKLNWVLWAKMENNSSYWVLCNNSKTGLISSGFSTPVGGGCPLP